MKNPLHRKPGLRWFFRRRGAVRLKPDAPRLHIRTRPGAWQAWTAMAGQTLNGDAGQVFDHFYFSLQAAVAGLGVAIGLRHLVRDDLANGVLAAPAGFAEDDSRYCLLAPAPLAPDSPPGVLLGWLREAAG